MEKSSNKSIAALIKATRKFHRLQQTEFSAILGVTQGTISKIEAASMGPELGLWFKFLRAFNIQDPYCFTYYGLEFDQNSFANLKTEGSALAPNFDFSKENYIFTIKTIRPLFDLITKNHSKAFDVFLKENKIAQELFFILNHPVTTEIADKFFAFLEANKINAKSVALLDLNFEYALGRDMKDISSSESSDDLFNIINNNTDSSLEYEFSGVKGEYFINLKNQNNAQIKNIGQSELIMNYNFLYPYHVMKSIKNFKTKTPKIQEIKKDTRWHVTYA